MFPAKFRLKLNWGPRIILQFVLVMVPLFALIGIQDFLDWHRARQLSDQFPVYVAATRADQSFDVFVGGVVDAVDTGKLSDKALLALATTEKQLKVVSERTVDQATSKLLQDVRDLSAGLQKQDDLKALLGYQKQITAIRTRLHDLNIASEAAATRTIDQSIKDALMQVSAGVMASFLLVGMTVAFLFNMIRRLTKPLNQGIDLAQSIASGNIKTLEHHPGNDETARLINALSDMSSALLDIVSLVTSSASSVHDTSEQMSASHRDLSVRTAKAARNLSVTAQGVVQLGMTSDLSAGSAKRATDLTEQALDQARHGSATVDSMQRTMEDIAERSKRIDSINGMIEGIAFQTNILALNAAVEAARAGEHGRGFAVVAGEVRALAQRSTQAAKEIKGLVSSTLETVEKGSGLAGEAGASMAKLVEQIRQAREMIEEANGIMGAQVEDIASIGKTLSALDVEMQQNASMVEQYAEATSVLSEDAQMLMKAISVFHGEGAASGAEPAHSP